MAAGAQAQTSPSFPDVPASELHELLSRKLAQCGVMFDFLDCVADLKGKEVKRAALNELVECVGSTRGVLIEPVYPDIIRMVSTWHPASGGGPGGHGNPTDLLTFFCLAPSPRSSFPTLPSSPTAALHLARVGNSVPSRPVPSFCLCSSDTCCARPPAPHRQPQVPYCHGLAQVLLLPGSLCQCPS